MAKVTRKDDRVEVVDRLVDQVLAHGSLYRVETRLKGSAQQPMIDVFIDGDRGVTINECASVGRALRASIELEGLFKGDFKLEVSSPGLGRPLQLPRQYRRHLGRTLQVTVGAPEAESTESISGRLVVAAPAGIAVEQGSERVKLRFDEIQHAVVVPSLDPLARSE